LAGLIHVIYSEERKRAVKTNIGQLLPSMVRALMFCIGLGLLGPSTIAQAAPGDSNATTIEQRVKAASLYKFLGYVEWPPVAFATPAAPYVVGVAGADEIAEELLRISAGRTVSNRPLVVKNLKFGEPLAGMHVLFIGRNERTRQTQWLQLAQKHPTLTVTETEGALAQGSMINFRLVDERVRFEVSLEAVEKSEVRVSARMLSVALSVLKGTRQ
jgi:hypothetical protein